MKIEVHLKHQSHPIVCDNVRNAYQKGALYCVMYVTGMVDKFPIADIFRVREYPAAK
jgi:hypothetical protein